MDSQPPHLAPVLSLSLHRLQREPRAIHRAFLSRPSIFRRERNVKGVFHADGAAFLSKGSQVRICIAQMIVQAQDSILVVGEVDEETESFLRSKRHVKIRRLAAEAGERLLVVDERVALLGCGSLAVVTEGAIARALSDLFQISIHRESPRGRTSWPLKTRLDLESVEVGLARTWPKKDRAPIIESERLLLSSLRCARRFIYAEVSAFTSPVIVKALVARLKKPDAPEIVLILPRGGILQESALDRIMRADRNEKFRAYEASEDSRTNLVVVDDQLMTVGSTQWTSKSLGASRSVDLAIEALGRPAVVMAIARLRRERLGRWLKIDPSEFDARFLLKGSLIATIESFFTLTRYLNEITPRATRMTRIAFALSPILDPKRPQAVERWLRKTLRFGPKTWRFALIFAIIFALLVMFSTVFAPFG